MVEASVYENYWNDGLRRWRSRKIKFDLNEIKTKPVSPSDFIEYIKNSLEGCDIKSDQARDRLYARRNGILFYDFVISKIVSVTRVLNYLKIDTEDNEPFYLKFLSEGESSKAENRIIFILNGFEIIDCDDELLHKCDSPQQILINYL